MQTSLAYTLLIGIIAASVAAWVFVCAKWVKKSHPIEYWDRQEFDWHILVVFLIALSFGIRAVSTQASPKPTLDNIPDLGIFLDHIRRTVIVNGIIAAFVPGLLAIVSKRDLLDFGFGFDGWQRQLRIGFFGFLAAALPVAAVQWLMVVTSMRTDADQHPFLLMLQEYPQFSVIVWVSVSVIIFAPAAEELLFRVVLQGALQSRFHPAVAIVGSSLAFSFVHAWPNPLPLLPLAVILGYVFYRTNSYLAVVTIHALFNAANLALALSTAVEPSR